MNTISLGPDSHFHIYIMLQVYIFSAWIREQSLTKGPCSCPRGTLHRLPYASVVYFNLGGCVDVHRPPYTLKYETVCAKVVVKSSKGSHYSWPSRPATFSLHCRCLGRCQGYLPVKIGQITGWPQAPVSLMWLGMRANKYMLKTTKKHTQLNRHAEVDAYTQICP